MASVRRERADSGHSLGTYGDRPTAPPFETGSDRVRRQGSRGQRAQLKRAQRRLTDSVSSRLCWSPVAAEVPVDVGRQGVAHVGGVRRCGSPHSCPFCAPAIRAKRAEEIERGVRAHLDAGGGALFVTLTLRHSRADELEPRLALASTALRHCLEGRQWRQLRERVGYVGSIRSVETTWGEASGWHPHVHAVLLLEGPVGEAMAAAMQRALFERWGLVCERAGFGSITAAHGVDVQVVNAGGDLGQLGAYLTKLEKGDWGVGHELARGDVKTGRGRDRWTPFELLAEFVATGEARFARLWQEYERATFGKRALVWSRGLRERLLPGEVEKSDQELAASEGMEPEFVRYLVESGEWWASVKAGAVGDLLSQVEAAAAEFWKGESDAEEQGEAEGEGSEAPTGDRARRAGAGGRREPSGDGLGGASSRRHGHGGVDARDVPALPGGAVALIPWGYREKRSCAA